MIHEIKYAAITLGYEDGNLEELTALCPDEACSDYLFQGSFYLRDSDFVQCRGCGVKYEILERDWDTMKIRKMEEVAA